MLFYSAWPFKVELMPDDHGIGQGIEPIAYKPLHQVCSCALKASLIKVHRSSDMLSCRMLFEPFCL